MSEGTAGRGGPGIEGAGMQRVWCLPVGGLLGQGLNRHVPPGFGGAAQQPVSALEAFSQAVVLE